MTPAKRFVDIAGAIFLGLLLSPVMIVVALLVLIRDGRPILYLSERMRTVDQGFTLYKFRTMTVVASDTGVTGGDKAARVTKLGKILRKTRIDEFPQLWNVLRGDMSFVGPRPPARQYVKRFPQIYGEVLKSRPGITGLATMVIHKHEERILAGAKSPQETDQIYVRRSVPRKAKLDLIYQRNHNICWDFQIMWSTVASRFSASGKRPKKKPARR